MIVIATIKEIAQRAGFSPATVSRLLNNDPDLSITVTTRQKIMAAADELGYWEDHQRKLVQPHQLKLALLYRISGEEQLQDEYFSFLRRAIVKAAGQAKIHLEEFYRIEDLIAQAASFQGFIAVGANKITMAQLKTLHAKLPSGVFIDIDPAPTLFDSVKPNLELTVQDALRRLVAAGHERIGFIGGTGLNLDNVQQRDAREVAFREFTSLQGVKAAPLFIGNHFNVKTGYQLGKRAITEMGDHLPDAFIVASDTLSVGVLQAFNEAGVNIPRDTVLVSINNSAVANYVSPPLSSYNINQATLSRMAIILLRDLIKHPTRPHVHLQVNTNLIVRKSFVPRNNHE